MRVQRDAALEVLARGLLSCLRVAPAQRVDHRDQDSRAAHGLAEVRAGSDIDRGLRDTGVLARADQQRRGLGMLPGGEAKQIKPGFACHADLAEQQRDRVVCKHVARFACAADVADVKAAVGEDRRQSAAHRDVAVDDEDAPGRQRHRVRWSRTCLKARRVTLVALRDPQVAVAVQLVAEAADELGEVRLVVQRQGVRSRITVFARLIDLVGITPATTRTRLVSETTPFSST